MLQNIQKNITQYIKKDIIFVVGVSGGPDSMFMLYNLTQVFKLKNLDKKNIKIAIYNHNFRKETEKEINFLKKYLKNFDIYIEKYKGKDFRESILRSARYNFFKKLGWGNENVILLLGHNLTDRIETSIINIGRGAGLKGFLNMNIYNKKQKILRPLLDYTKKDIQKMCDIKKIPYFLDYTNLDSKISKRNFVRNEIFPKLEELSPNFYKNINIIYNQIEKNLPKINIENIVNKLYKNKNIEIYKADKEKIEYYIGKYDKFFIREFMDYFEIYDFRKGVIDEIKNYIKKAKGGGYKLYNNTFITKKQKKIYIGKIKNKKNINIKDFVKKIINKKLENTE